MSSFLSLQDISNDVLAYIFPDRGWITQDLSTSSSSLGAQITNMIRSKFFLFDDLNITTKQEYFQADATEEEPENDATDIFLKKPLTMTLTITILGHYLDSLLKLIEIDKIDGSSSLTTQRMIMNSKYSILKSIADAGKPVDLVFNGRVFERMVFNNLSDSYDTEGNEMIVTADLTRKSYMDSRQLIIDGQIQTSTKISSPINKKYSDFMNSGAMKIIDQVSQEIGETLLTELR